MVNRELFLGAFLVLVNFMIATEIVLAQEGYIQIESEPGVTVFLNDNLQGVTSSEFGGLIIQNVPAGNHLLRFTLDGFNPQEEQIALRPGQVYAHRVRPFVPRVRITEHGKTGDQQIGLQVGRLKIQSLPVAITITIPELEVEYNKSSDKWKAHELEWEGDFNRAPLVQPLSNYHCHQTDSDAVISVRFEVRQDGTVGRLQPIINANPELEREGLRTLRTWRFSRLPANMPQEYQYGTITF